MVDSPTQPIPSNNDEPETALSRPWVIYGLGFAFIVLLFVCYIQADIVLGWMESVVHTLFIR